MRWNEPFESSGNQLPKVLHDKWALQNGRMPPDYTTTATTTTTTNTQSNNTQSTVNNKNTDTFTSLELETHLASVSRALVDIQKQVQGGEETYYDEAPTNNIFRGWDSNFIDAREPNNANNMAVPRRLPMDFRWFSGSITSATIKPTGLATRVTPENVAAKIQGSRERLARENKAKEQGKAAESIQDKMDEDGKVDDSALNSKESTEVTLATKSAENTPVKGKQGSESTEKRPRDSKTDSSSKKAKRKRK
jgi:hypothetical protein